MGQLRHLKVVRFILRFLPLPWRRVSQESGQLPARVRIQFLKAALDTGLGFGATFLEFILYSNEMLNRMTTGRGTVDKGLIEVAT